MVSMAERAKCWYPFVLFISVTESPGIVIKCIFPFYSEQVNT